MKRGAGGLLLALVALFGLAGPALIGIDGALLATLAAAVPGVLLGLLAAWQGGRVERVLVLLADAAMSIPGLLLVVLCAAILPGRKEMLALGLALVMWVEHFRVSRSVSRPVLAGDAVQAARLLGFGPLHLLRRHLLPALAPQLGTLLAFGAAQAVLGLAALGFISVGVQPPAPELGLMMTEALPHWHEAPWLIAAPVAVLMLTVLGMMLLVGDEETGA